MFSMSKLRDRQKGLLWTLLFFFIASMSVGGLVGGANIIDVIRSAFGGVNTTLHVGRVGDENISISYYLTERQKQINRFRQQGRNIDSRAIQNAGDFAWNAIIERKIKDEKIEELNLSVQDDEIYDYLLNTPPIAFQNNLKDLGLYNNEDNIFDLEKYQNDIMTGQLPDTSRQVLFAWENYLRTFLADRKLQNLYNNFASVSKEDVKNNYLQNNINCIVDILNINTNSIPDSLIDISDNEIEEYFNKNKDEKYTVDENVTMEYYLFENIDDSGLDSTAIVEKQDSLLQLAIDFASDAEILSFQDALSEYNLNKTDTVNVTESFKNNSGIPFQMGALRQAVRFAFDNTNGETSDALPTDNGIAVFHILGKNSSSYQNLDDVKQSINRTLIREKKNDYAINNFNSLELSNSWANIAENNEFIDLHKDVTSTIGGSFKIVGKNSEMTGMLHEMEINQTSKIIESSSNIYVFRLKEKDTFDQTEFEAIYDSLNLSILQVERNLIYNNWLNNEKENIKIKDMRSKIF